ncbi:hypothetical protein HMPREF0454_03305 [Hafnia alvei ATCC 51873]|jgi:uncharacterized protein YqcC (DUF446 family)|uniref:YqcC-like domain-containing protein n=2 Tax=Hafniaceae TaxID=1903412 RepID=G9Y9P0_HAFAL|nr:hypothetical protein HMPREF0454_03305 [Hafnia alvei ATCC 51873]
MSEKSMSEYAKVRQHLLQIEQQLDSLHLSQECAPDAQAFESKEPFCVDTMAPEQWLQWILLPRMFALLDSQSPLPRRFAIAPYFEVAFKERLLEVQPLIVLLQQLDDMLNQEDAN